MLIQEKPLACITDFIFVNMKPEKADVILVPGGSHPQPMEEAARLFLVGMAPFILPSGGKNVHLPAYDSEWQFLQERGLALGVPETAILKEDRARNTFENARFSRTVLQEQNIAVRKAILVCKAFHARRALLTYQVCFPREVRFIVCSVPDKRGITRENWFLDAQFSDIVMGEVGKIGEYFRPEIKKLIR